MFNELAPLLSLLRTDDVVLWRARLPMDHLDVNLWLTYLVPEQLCDCLVVFTPLEITSLRWVLSPSQNPMCPCWKKN
jgi:hypothetical protein